jgi:hypothetical protein
MGRGQKDEVDEELDELDNGLKRLRVEYDQYFLGILKRAPEVLQGRIQKVIVKFSNEQLRKTHQKFRFNQLNSKFQIHRQQWGRTMRESRTARTRATCSKAKLHEARPRRLDANAQSVQARCSAEAAGPMEKLFHAFVAARKRAGDAGPAPAAPAPRDREEVNRRAEAEAPGREGEIPRRDRGQQSEAGRAS